MIKRPLVWIAVVFMLGIAAKEKRILTILIVCIFLMLAAISHIWQQGGRKNMIFLFLPLIMLAGYMMVKEAETGSELKQKLQTKEKAVVHGRVTGITGSTDNFLVNLSNTQIYINGESFEGKSIAVYIEECSGVAAGNIIEATGTLYPYLPSTNPGQFDEDAYYSARGTDGKLYADSMKIVSDKKNYITDYLIRLRYELRNAMMRALPEKESGVAVSMILGDKSMLDSEIKELYSQNGIIHILSISGLHISMIGMALYGILRCICSIRISMSVTVSVMVLYGTMTGMSVSTKRAIIMLSIMLSARIVRKVYDMISAAALSAIIILLDNPLMLYDCGFQLSFSAVIGIAIAGMFKTDKKILDSLIISAAAQIMTLPVILNNFYGFSPYSVVLNIIILPFMSMVVGMSAISGALMCILPFAGRFTAGTVHYILSFYELLCRGVKLLPGAYINTGAPDSVQIIFYYAVISLAVYLFYRKNKSYIMLMLTLCLTILIKFDRNGFYTAFLDVGQGDSIYIESGSCNYLVDCGSSSIKKAAEYRILPFLAYRGADKIDYLIITHPDSDHMNGFSAILAEAEVENVVFPISGIDNEKIISAAGEAEEKGINTIYISAGEEIAGGLECLNPDRETVYKNSNSYSVVLSLTYNNLKLLLTGDAEGKGETKTVEYLREHYYKDYTILKVAHHGSGKSTGEELTDIINPEYSVISCAENNRYGHPDNELLERLRRSNSKIFITYETGAIIVKNQSSDKFKLTTYRK